MQCCLLWYMQSFLFIKYLSVDSILILYPLKNSQSEISLTQIEQKHKKNDSGKKESNNVNNRSNDNSLIDDLNLFEKYLTYSLYYNFSIFSNNFLSSFTSSNISSFKHESESNTNLIISISYLNFSGIVK